MTEGGGRMLGVGESGHPSSLGLRSMLVPMIPAGVAVLVGFVLFAFGNSTLRILGLAIAGLPFLIMSIETLKRTLLLVLLLEIPFPIDIYFGHQRPTHEFTGIAVINPDHVNAIAGYNVSVATMCLLVLYVLWAIEYLARRSGGSPIELGSILPVSAYTAVVVLSLFLAQNAVLASFEIVIVIQALMLMVYIVKMIRTEQDLLFVVAILMVGLAAQSLLAISQGLWGFEFELGPLKTSDPAGRSGGTLGGHNQLGSYLGLLLPPAVALSLSRIPTRHRLLGVFSAGLGILALLFSGSRGAWAGFTVSMALVTVVALRNRWITWKTIAITATASIILVLVFFGETIGDRFTTGATLEGRLDLTELAFSMILDNTVFGVGANNYAFALDPHLTVDFTRSWVSTVHNKYLLVWAETGIIGLAAFLWVLGSALHRLWIAMHMNLPLASPIALGLAGGILANMVHMWVEIYHSRTQTQMLWLIIGLAMAIHLIVRSRATYASVTARS